MIDYGIRAPDRQTALDYLLKRGILLEQTDEGLRFAPGIAYDEHPITIILKPAELDKNGDVVIPAVIDSNYHANIRFADESLIPELYKGGTTRQTLAVTKASVEESQKTKAIPNRTVDSVTIYKLSDIATPSRVWL
jgi:hypothetical protein